MVANDKTKEQYIETLIKEVHQKSKNYGSVNTVYIGGGTPSSLSLPLLKSLFKAIKETVDVENLEEYTIECNVEDISEELIQVFFDYHINRISIGIQSFDSSKLKILGRNHSYLETLGKIKTIREVYNSKVQINIDLMYAVQGETMETLQTDLDLIMALRPDHISIYSLILEERTLLHHQFLKEEYQVFDEDLESEMYFQIRSYLMNQGYHHYETSNYAKPGCTAKHNLKYWDLETYLGLGAAASNFINNMRFTNPRNLQKYYDLVNGISEEYAEMEHLLPEDLMKEEIIIGLRKVDGISIARFYERYQISIYEKFSIIEVLLEKNWLKEEEGYLKLPTDKLYLANFVLKKFI
jgi:oxygen-independent coproporphyrinogen-3 oxidase